MTTTYVYDNLRRLVQILYSNGRVTTITYDQIGNRVSVVTVCVFRQTTQKKSIRDADSLISKQNGIPKC